MQQPTFFDPATYTRLANTFRALHSSGKPLVLTNVWDAPSASLALSNPKTKAVATASFAIAAVLGIEDEDLTLEDNLAAIRRISHQFLKLEKYATIPLSVDLQGGYEDRLAEAVRKVVHLGAVGINLEDSVLVDDRVIIRSVDDQVARIRLAISVAAEEGVAGFAVNARTDCVLLGGTIEEAVSRGREYLEAGAVTVFVWGGLARGLRDGEVLTLVKELDGRVNVIYRKSMENALSIKQLAEIGVARISMGPALWREGMAAVGREMGRILEEAG